MGAQSKGKHPPRNPAGNRIPAKRPVRAQAENTESTPTEGTGQASTGTRVRRGLLSGTNLVITGALAAIIGGLVLAWLLGSNSGMPNVTQQILFQPWSTNGAGGVLRDIQVVSNGRGYCWTHSAFTGRPDAYRCGYGNNILDPCISNPYEGYSSKQVICPYPGLSSITLISLTRVLPSSSKASNAPVLAENVVRAG